MWAGLLMMMPFHFGVTIDCKTIPSMGVNHRIIIRTNNTFIELPRTLSLAWEERPL